MSKSVRRRYKSNTYEEPSIVDDNPMSNRKIRNFIEETEGRENKGNDPRTNNSTKSSMSEKEFKRQQEAMRRLKERGWRMEGED